MNPNSEPMELRANKNLIKGSGQQQSKLYLIVNIGVDYESVEWDILSSYVLLVCFHKDNKVNKAKFFASHSLKRGTPQFLLYFILYYIYFSLFSCFLFCEQYSSFICCKVETPKTSTTVKR